VRALGQLGGEQAAAVLRELLTPRVSFFPEETKRFRSEVRRMLNRIAGKLPQVAPLEEAPPGGVP